MGGDYVSQSTRERQSTNENEQEQSTDENEQELYGLFVKLRDNEKFDRYKTQKEILKILKALDNFSSLPDPVFLKHADAFLICAVVRFVPNPKNIKTQTYYLWIFHY